MASQGLEGVIFDADGVIQSIPDGSLDYLATTLDIDMAALAELFVAEQPAITGHASLAAALAPALASLGRERLLDEIVALWCTADVHHDALTVVEQLRRSGVRCYLGTNQPDVRAAFMRTTLDYDHVFDLSFYSCELGFAKPDTAYFEAILERVGHAGSQLLFIDDKPENVEGAIAAGLHGEVYERRQGVARLQAILASYGLAR